MNRLAGRPGDEHDEGAGIRSLPTSGSSLVRIQRLCGGDRRARQPRRANLQHLAGDADDGGTPEHDCADYGTTDEEDQPADEIREWGADRNGEDQEQEEEDEGRHG